MNDDPILVDIKKKIAIVSFNRPEVLNCFSLNMLEMFHDKLKEFKDSGLKVILFTGKGRAFSTGNDLKELRTPEHTRRFVYFGIEVCKMIFQLPQITISAVNGYALGGGFELAMSTDFRVASEHAIFGLPEVTIGLLPIWAGLAILPRLVGVHAAKEIIFSGKRYTAEEASQWGIINKIVPHDKLMEESLNFAEKYRRLDPNLIQMAKYMLNQSLEIPFLSSFEKEKEMFEVFAAKDKIKKIEELWKDIFP